MKYLANFDLDGNQLLNAVLQQLATPPTNPVKGQMYFDTSQDRAFIRRNNKWEGMDGIDAAMTGADIVAAINASVALIDKDNLAAEVVAALNKAHSSHAIGDVTGLQGALDDKVAVIAGKGLSENDFTDILATKLTGITAGATKVVKSTNGKIKINDVDTDVYSHPGGDGSLHVPATGTSNNNKVLKAGATAGSLVWGVDNDTITTINGKTGAILKTDITALGIPAQDTTYNTFTTAVNGLVPKPATAAASLFLNAAGTWTTPPDTKYTLPIATGAILGGVKAGANVTIDSGGQLTVNSNGHDHTVANVTGLQGVLDGKETPAGALAKATAAGDAAKTYVDNKIADLVGSAPDTLDTLQELAAALGADQNFATTVTTELAKKTNKFSKAIGDGASTSIVVTHNLNSRDVVAMLRDTASPYAQVFTDVELTTVNTATIKFATAPASNAYTITIIG